MHRRLQLRPLWNLLQHDENRFRLTHSKWDKQLTAKELVSTLIRRGLRIKNPRDLELYQEFLLKQPLRSVLQVMSRCAPYLTSEGANDQTDTWDLELSEALSESLRALALGSLYKFGVDVDAIAAHELPALTKAVFDLAVRDGDFDTAVYLRPQPSDADLKNSFAALSADVTRLCAEKPAALIDYMLTAPVAWRYSGRFYGARVKTFRPKKLARAFAYSSNNIWALVAKRTHSTGPVMLWQFFPHLMELTQRAHWSTPVLLDSTRVSLTMPPLRANRAIK